MKMVLFFNKNMHKKKGLVKRVLFFINLNQTKLIVLSLLFLFSLYASQVAPPNRIQKPTRKTLAKSQCRMVKKVKNLSTVKIQTCFPEF
jgi:hypothetical protein